MPSSSTTVSQFTYSKHAINLNGRSCIHVTEYCHLYLALNSNDCALNVGAVCELCDIPVSTESALRSVADVKVLLTSSIFLPVPSRPPCRSAPRCTQLRRVKGVKTLAPPGHQHLDTCVYESQPQCQHHDHNMHHTAASHIPAKQCHWSAARQHRPENKSTIACLVTLMANVF